MHQQVASIPTMITVPYMNIPAITDASTDTVEENICDRLGTNPIRLNAKDILPETFDMMGPTFLPPLITNEDGGIGANRGPYDKSVQVYVMRPDIPYCAAMKWEYGQYGRLAREHTGVPNSGPFAGLNMKKLRSEKPGIHCEVFLARLREIGIGATMLNKAAYRSV
jgi:hypothetical protein